MAETTKRKATNEPSKSSSAKPKTTKTRTPRTKKEKTPYSDVKKLKLLITVVPRSKGEFYTDFLEGFDINFQTMLLGKGTAKSETLRLLGLADSDKSVILSVITQDKSEEITRALDDKFNSLKRGKGIAFTVPISSVIGVAIYRFLSNSRKI